MRNLIDSWLQSRQPPQTPEPDHQISEISSTARAQAIAVLEETKATREHVVTPIFHRLSTRLRHNGFGEDYELSLTPRKATS